MTAAKRAEAASFDADVGKIDVAIDDVSYDIADRPGAQVVGGGDHHEKIGAVGIEKKLGLIDAEIMTG